MKRRGLISGVCLFCMAAWTAALWDCAAHAQDGVNFASGPGHGYVRYVGSGVFQITGGNGVLIVSQHQEDSGASPPEVLFSPATDRSGDGDFIEPMCLPASNGGCVYRISDTFARIQGDALAISFAGANIGMTASGAAALTLQGVGYCITQVHVESTVEYGMERWTLGGTSITLKKR